MSSEPTASWASIILPITRVDTMYLRSVHAEHDIPTLYSFIHSHPLGLLTTGIPSQIHPFLQTSHIPFVLTQSASPNADTGDLGILRGHVARANPQAKAMMESLTSSPAELSQEVLVLFTGPDHYISPKFYTETKPATGKVVPTWDYAAVQVYGKATVYFDTKHPSTSTFLDSQIRDLTELGESGLMGSDEPWTVEMAPEKYIEALKKAIIGVEIRITRLQGKWKMSQEEGPGDRDGVEKGLRAVGTEQACKVADMVKKRGELKEP